MMNLKWEMEELLDKWIAEWYSDLDMGQAPVREFADEAKTAVDKAAMDYMADAIYRMQHLTK
jgi:hypothetical protein